MPDLEAYRASLGPHTHEWQPLTSAHDWCPDYDWCPACGATRLHPDAED